MGGRGSLLPKTSIPSSVSEDRIETSEKQRPFGRAEGSFALKAICLNRNGSRRLMPHKPVVGDEQIADQRDKERVLDAQLICGSSEQEGNNSATHNRRHDQTRSFARHWAKTGDAKRKDVREHDGVEESAEHHAPDRH